MFVHAQVLLLEAIPGLGGMASARPPLPARPESPVSRPLEPVQPTSASRTEFRAVYDQHFDFVWRFAGHRGVPPSALDDVVQEVFLVVNRQLPSFEGRSALRTWIAGIARNVIRGYLRKRSNAVAGEPLEDDDRYASELPLPDEALEHKSAGQLLDVILARMSELQREAFILCEVEGLSAVEVAAALEVNESTLRARLKDARYVFDTSAARLTAQRAWAARVGRSQP